MARDNIRLFTIIISCLLLVVLKVQGQELTFISPLVEGGVRQHLNLADEEQISFLQLDTITSLDLSRRGITDIRDLVLMPKLRVLDLSDNQVKDLCPLAILDSLEWVDLRYNNLKGINELYYSTAKNMTINVSFNYIEDFSLFAYLSSCNFTLIGTGLQYSENPIYFEVNSFYADINGDEQLVINYRGYTNLKAATYLKCGSSSLSAQLDGNAYQVPIPEDVTKTTQVTISNDEICEETYVVPSAIYAVGAGKTAILETGLPEDYYLYSAYASKGTVEIAGNKLKYTAPAKAVSDIVVFSYYQGATLKGFSRYSVNLGKKGDVNISSVVDVQDATLTVNYILGNSSDEYDYIVADMNNDGEVDVFDVTAIINAILGEDGNPAAARRLAGQEENRESIHLNASESGLLFGIDRADRFTSFQFDIEVPDGTELLGVEWIGDIGHALQFAKNGENRYRAVALSLSSAALPVTDGALLRLRLSDTPDGEIRVGNVLFVTPDGKAARFSDGTLSMTNGIQGATLNGKGEMKDEKWYDLQGRQLNKKRGQLHKGVYIINNKQVMIK